MRMSTETVLVSNSFRYEIPTRKPRYQRQMQTLTDIITHYTFETMPNFSDHHILLLPHPHWNDFRQFHVTTRIYIHFEVWYMFV